jgi:trehalose/maltose hydrolase-like predicted phosphorylase
MCGIDDAEFAKGELHVTGGVAVMAGQYFYTTRSVDWLRGTGYPMLEGIARFWASRVVKVQDSRHCIAAFFPSFFRYSVLRQVGAQEEEADRSACALRTFPQSDAGADVYEVRGVVPPDEYAGVVDNSVYTNQIAREALHLAAMASRLFERFTDEVGEWEDIARHLLLPYSEQQGYHPEFAGQARVYVGAKVKQADAILLGYPLNHVMPARVRQNDLNIYRTVTDQDGMRVGAVVLCGCSILIMMCSLASFQARRCRTACSRLGTLTLGKRCWHGSTWSG